MSTPRFSTIESGKTVQLPPKRSVREPKEQPYGTVAVFEDFYGNLWDLLELKVRQGLDG